MNVSKRLNRLALMVTEGSRLADVGTDHGYVPICLCSEKRIPSAIAMDINRGPLERANCHIQEAGLETYIETRLSDGLTALRKGEADTILIAGMGGPLMEKILSRGKEVLATARELVLQPQSEIDRVRRWLSDNGFQIAQEDIVLDEGKYYPMFRAVHGHDEPYLEVEYLYGKPELQKSVDVLLDFLQKNLEARYQIRKMLPETESSRIEKRRREVEREIEGLEYMIKKYFLLDSKVAKAHERNFHECPFE